LDFCFENIPPGNPARRGEERKLSKNKREFQNKNNEACFLFLFLCAAKKGAIVCA
jgi:hypothetical protein